MFRRNSRLNLGLALTAFVGMAGVVFDQVARQLVRIVITEPGSADAAVVYVFALLMMTLFLLLISLPVLMIIAYRGLRGDMLTAQVMASLALCALDDEQLQSRIREYQESNALAAFFLPSVLNLVTVFIVWQNALLPRGVDGLLARLGDSSQVPLSLAMVFAQAAVEISPLTWALLGAYFYALNLIIRRWMLSDLTTNVLWKINVRLVQTFILGMLLIAVGGGAGVADGFGSYVAGLGFIIGIVPDLFLRWLGQQLKRLGGIDIRADGLFAPPDLQRKIEGMSFWQVDRLGEEGIESVYDLAMKEIPSLLIRTRFDVPLLLNWVDRALLCSLVDPHLECFKHAHLYTGTALMAAVARPHGMETLLRGLNGAAANGATETAAGGLDGATLTITEPMIDNIMSGLASGPNLRYLVNYQANANRAALLPAAGAGGVAAVLHQCPGVESASDGAAPLPSAPRPSHPRHRQAAALRPEQTTRDGYAYAEVTRAPTLTRPDSRPTTK